MDRQQPPTAAEPPDRIPRTRDPGTHCRPAEITDYYYYMIFQEYLPRRGNILKLGPKASYHNPNRGSNGRDTPIKPMVLSDSTSRPRRLYAERVFYGGG